MKKLSICSLLIGFVLLSCNQNPDKQITAKEINFSKEGELYLLKNSGDTIRKLEIEIADNAYERETGLMYRSELKEDHAMLFIFEDEKQRGFYMKNTQVSLDILFLNADREIVKIAPETEPYNEETVPSDAPAKYVLEINAGLAQQWNLETGDKISYTTD